MKKGLEMDSAQYVVANERVNISFVTYALQNKGLIKRDCHQDIVLKELINTGSDVEKKASVMGVVGH